ncbi:MAG: lytic murein transglycosylase, partial [Thermodesulfobacteriota bacterium]
MKNILVLLLVLLLLPAVSLAAAKAGPKAADQVKDGQVIDLTSPRYQKLFAELKKKHGYSQAELDKIFAGVTIKQRVLVLMDSQWEAKPYYDYWPRFITDGVIRNGKEKLKKHKKILDRVEKELGVERETVVAIWGIETRYGTHKGAFDLFQTLNTMFDAYPRRSKFYRGQLVAFLLLCRENGVDPHGVPASYGGAFGQTQFIPSSFNEYAVDFDHDGRRDVWKSEADVLGSIANYLRRFGWRLDAPVYAEIGPKLKSSVLTKAYKKGRKGRVSVTQVAKAQGLKKMPAAPGGKKVAIVGLELDKKGAMRYVAGYPNFQAITAWNNSNRYAMAVSELAEKL